MERDELPEFQARVLNPFTIEHAPEHVSFVKQEIKVQ